MALTVVCGALAGSALRNSSWPGAIVVNITKGEGLTGCEVGYENVVRTRKGLLSPKRCPGIFNLFLHVFFFFEAEE